MKISLSEIINKYFNIVKYSNFTFFDCKLCKEMGFKSKFATEKDALIHFIEFHKRGGMYQYAESIRSIYGEKLFNEMIKRNRR